MKISKVFGFVLCLHLGVIGVLIVQPGCGTTQPPTQTYQQNRTTGSSTALTPLRSTEGLIPATRVEPTIDAAIDPAFNAGFNASTTERYAPNRAANEYSEFQEVTPQLNPIVAEPVLPTVDIAGASFETYTIKKGDNLWAISKRNNISLNELYAANGLNKKSVLKIGQQIQIPVEGGTGTVKAELADTYQPSNYNMATESYTVKGGDNLSKIAVKYNTSVNAIKAANNKTSDMIRVGDRLIIPVGGSKPTAAAPVKTVAPVTSSTQTTGIHTVKAGEYPATIARQYGMSALDLLAINDITDPRKIQIGQKLKVSSAGNTAKVATKTVAVAAPQPTPATPATVAQTAVKTSNDEPIAFRVVEADPVVEEEISELDTDAMFENAIEIPVIRMEDQ